MPEFIATFFNPEYTAYIIMFSAVGLALVYKAWGKSKGKTSAYGGDAGLNDIAISFFGTLLPARADVVIGGAQTFRAAWGARLLVGPILLGLLFLMDFEIFMADMSARDRLITEFVINAVAALVLFQWIKLAFFVRVRIEEDTITSFGHSLRPQSRDLNTLTGVELDGDKKLLKMQFAEDAPIYTTRFISPRKEFIAFLEDRARANTLAS